MTEPDDERKEAVPEFLQQFRAFYERLEPARRRTLLAATVTALIIVGGVGLWAAQPSFVVLTRADDPEQAATITRSLSQQGIPYRLDSDGLTVRVPEASELDARRAAASEDGIVGLEGLEQIDPWVTPFQEQLHRQRMLQGELSRTINTIHGIAASTVHINLPERSAFLRAEERATAAVTLRPEAGLTLSPAVARSVAELVSHSVAGMTTFDVRVVDSSSGRLLWGSEGTEGGGSGDETQTAAAREARLADGVRAALERLLGAPDAATVTVHVEVESTAVQTTENKIDPDSATAQQERTESVENGTNAASATGIPGTDSNIPERTAGATTTGSGSRKDLQQTTYEFSRVTTTTVKPAGDVRRLSAAVFVDTAALQALLAQAGEKADEAALKKDIESAVRAALGVNDERGDQVVVSFVAFAPAAMSETEISPTSTIVERSLAPAVAALAVILAFFLLVRPLIQATRPASAAATRQAAARAAAATAGAPALGDDEPLPANVEDFSARLRKQVERFQSTEPKHVSDLVRHEADHSAEVVRRWIRS